MVTILGDPGADSGDEEKSKRAEKYTAISRKVVGKSARDNPERHCGWFWIHSSSEKFERIGTKGNENVFASANGKQQK